MTKQFEKKIQEIIGEACDKCEYSTDGGERLLLENQVKDIVKKAIEALWHKPDEEPKSDKEVLVEYKSGFHDAGYYAENEKIFYTGNELAKKDDITRWAYIEDFVNL